MTTKQIVTLTDDIDGSNATETVSFQLDGTLYEIDLNGKHAVNLRGLINSYAVYARKVSGSTRGKFSRKRNPDSAEMRAWGIANGYAVNPRGRVPADVQAAYAAARKPAPAPARAPESNGETREPGPGHSHAAPAASPLQRPRRAPAHGPGRVLEFREPPAPARAPESNGETREPGPGRSHAAPAASPLQRPPAPASEPPAAGSTPAIRQWAREKGIEISIRGRIPDEIRNRYLAEMGDNGE